MVPFRLIPSVDEIVRSPASLPRIGVTKGWVALPVATLSAWLVPPMSMVDPGRAVTLPLRADSETVPPPRIEPVVSPCVLGVVTKIPAVESTEELPRIRGTAARSLPAALNWPVTFKLIVPSGAVRLPSTVMPPAACKVIVDFGLVTMAAPVSTTSGLPDRFGARRATLVVPAEYSGRV